VRKFDLPENGRLCQRARLAFLLRLRSSVRSRSAHRSGRRSYGGSVTTGPFLIYTGPDAGQPPPPRLRFRGEPGLPTHSLFPHFGLPGTRHE
jgi:hypothetical protein